MDWAATVISGFREKVYENLPNRYERQTVNTKDPVAVQTNTIKTEPGPEQESEYHARISKLKKEVDRLEAKERKIIGRLEKLKNAVPALKKTIRQEMAKNLMKSRARMKSIMAKINHKEVEFEKERDRVILGSRQSMAGKLSRSRSRLLRINEKINNQANILQNKENEIKEIDAYRKNTSQKIYDQVQQLLENHRLFQNEDLPYPKPPAGKIKPSPEAYDINDIPEVSGIYFIWAAGRVVYVGQSTNINRRVRLGTHEKIKETDTISFLPYPKQYLTWAECYYIGILKPTRNGGTPC